MNDHLTVRLALGSAHSESHLILLLPLKKKILIRFLEEIIPIRRTKWQEVACGAKLQAGKM